MGQIKVHFQGLGQLNGPVIIDKIIELDEQYFGKLYGRDRDEIAKSIMAVHYPGVEINNVSYTRIEEKKEIFSEKNKNLMKGAVVGGAIATVAANRKNKDKNNKEDEREYKSTIAKLFIKDTVADDTATAVVSRKRKKKEQSGQGAKQEIDFTQELAPFLNIPLNGSKENIQNNLDRIFIALKSYKWAEKPTDKNPIGKRNSIMMNQVFAHYKNGIRNLKKIELNEEEIKYRLRQLRKLKVKKAFNEYGVVIYVGMFFLFLILLLMIAG